MTSNFVEISTLTHSRTSQKHGKGEAEDGGQSSHTRIMARNVRDWESEGEGD
jgi:hypothetical protein